MARPSNIVLEPEAHVVQLTFVWEGSNLIGWCWRWSVTVSHWRNLDARSSHCGWINLGRNLGVRKGQRSCPVALTVSPTRVRCFIYRCSCQWRFHSNLHLTCHAYNITFVTVSNVVLIFLGQGLPRRSVILSKTDAGCHWRFCVVATMAPTKRPRNNAAVGAGFLLWVNDCMVWSFIGCQLLSKVIDSEWSLTASNKTTDIIYCSGRLGHW